MPGIAAPVLVIASEGDRLTPAAQARRVAAAAPDARLVLLPGGRHPAVLNDESGQGVRGGAGLPRRAALTQGWRSADDSAEAFRRGKFRP